MRPLTGISPKHADPVAREDYASLYAGVCAGLAIAIVLFLLTAVMIPDPGSILLAGALVIGAAFQLRFPASKRPKVKFHLVLSSLVQLVIIALTALRLSFLANPSPHVTLVLISAATLSASFFIVMVASILGLRLHGVLRSDQ